MKIAEIFSFGGSYGNHEGHRSYGGSERHYRHGYYSRSSYYGSHYDRHNGGGLLGILGRY